jgi:hypothetical protein
MDLQGTGDTRLALVALTNTRAINTDNPSAIHVRTAVIHGVNGYISPLKLEQKPGPLPLGSQLKEPVRRLAALDDRTQPTKFVRGQIWTLLDTRLAAHGPSGRNGLLWMSIRPSLTRTGLRAAVTRQGYVGVETNNLAYGDIAMSSDASKGLIVASLVGPTQFPSGAYTTFTATADPGIIHVYRPGVRPEDGATCYKTVNPENAERGCRWGDYSMANVSPSGIFWFETEYITPRLRTTLANWGTAIGRLPVSAVTSGG